MQRCCHRLGDRQNNCRDLEAREFPAATCPQCQEGSGLIDAQLLLGSDLYAQSVSALSCKQLISRTVASGLALFCAIRRSFCLPVGLYSRQWAFIPRHWSDCRRYGCRANDPEMIAKSSRPPAHHVARPVWHASYRLQSSQLLQLLWIGARPEI